MNGNFSLAQSLIAGMGQQQPPQPPQGGLAQAGGAPPQAMAKQGTDMALAAQNREEVLEPGLDAATNMGYQQYAQQLMQRLNASLPSVDAMRRAQAARGLMMQNVMETLQPRERSGMDTLAAGISSYDKPVMQGDMGAALAAMGRGAVASKKQFEDEEQKKALAAYSLMDKEMDQQQKLMADALGKQKLLTGGATPEFTLPDGTPVYKSGTRLVYIGKDGKPVEWLGAEKTVIGGDTLLNRRAALREQLIKHYVEETKLPLETAIRKATAEADSVSDDMLIQMGVGRRPTTPAAGTPRVESAAGVPPIAQSPSMAIVEPEGVAPRLSFDLSGLKPEDRQRVDKLMARYKADPSDALAEATARQIIALLGQPTVASPTPRKDTVAEKKDVALAEADAKRIAAQPAAESALVNSMASLSSYQQKISDVLNTQRAGLESALGMSGAVPLYGQSLAVPGGASARFMAAMRSVASNAAISALEEMRKSSPTGGAVGNVTEKEWPLLMSKVAALAPNEEGRYIQSEKQMMDALKEVYDQIEGMKKRYKAAYEREYLKPVDKTAGSQPTALPSREAIEAELRRRAGAKP